MNLPVLPNSLNSSANPDIHNGSEMSRSQFNLLRKNKMKTSAMICCFVRCIKYATLFAAIVPAALNIAAALLWAQSPIIAPNAKLELLADGLKFAEGPACDADGNVYFTDQPNDRILIWSTEGKLSTFLQPSGRSNGLSFDREGNLWACADEDNELWRITPSGEHTVVVKNYNGKRLNGPNDVWIHPNGGVYFTDPFYKRDYWKHTQSEQDAQCVYYLEPNLKNLIRVVDDMKQPNGIIGTPDGKVLYIADIGAQKTYKYSIRPDGTLADKTLFCGLGSDGMTIDDQGNVYLTGKGVTVFDSTGKQIEHISIDAPWTANVCFGGKDRRTLFITAVQNLFGLRMRVKGVGSP
jgi:gluconolactonase